MLNKVSKKTKLVNIYPYGGPVTSVTPPIRSTVMKVRKTYEEIRRCIIGRAIVEEILPNGKKLRLDFSNYDKDNYIKPVEPVVKSSLEIKHEAEQCRILVDNGSPVVEIDNTVSAPKKETEPAQPVAPVKSKAERRKERRAARRAAEEAIKAVQEQEQKSTEEVLNEQSDSVEDIENPTV